MQKLTYGREFVSQIERIGGMSPIHAAQFAESMAQADEEARQAFVVASKMGQVIGIELARRRSRKSRGLQLSVHHHLGSGGEPDVGTNADLYHHQHIRPG